MEKNNAKINDFYNELKEEINDENFFIFPEFKYYSIVLSIPLLKEQLSVQHLNLIFQLMISFEKTSALISMAKYFFTRKFKSFVKNLHV